jgi:predicted nuclease of predicted toxin-antitoxin system
MGRIRIFADNNFHRAILLGVIQRIIDIDVETARQAGLETASDEVILEYAATQNRVLLTHDAASMTVAAYNRLQQGKSSPGVIIVPQYLNIGRAIDEIATVLVASLPGELENRVIWLPL